LCLKLILEVAHYFYMEFECTKTIFIWGTNIAWVIRSSVELLEWLSVMLLMEQNENFLCLKFIIEVAHFSYMEFECTKIIFIWGINIAWVIRSIAELSKLPSVMLLMDLNKNFCAQHSFWRPPINPMWSLNAEKYIHLGHIPTSPG
jgi:hypothetical protein